MDPATPLPTGTVTFLFTDIEGHTRLWEQHPKAMRLALARHDVLLRHASSSTAARPSRPAGTPSASPSPRLPALLPANVEKGASEVACSSLRDGGETRCLVQVYASQAARQRDARGYSAGRRQAEPLLT
jgi:hypothetical protein